MSRHSLVSSYDDAPWWSTQASNTGQLHDILVLENCREGRGRYAKEYSKKDTDGISVDPIGCVRDICMHGNSSRDI